MLATILLYNTILIGVIAISLKAGWICFNPFVCIAISIMAGANYYAYPNATIHPAGYSVVHYLWVYTLVPWVGAVMAGITHLIIQKLLQKSTDKETGRVSTTDGLLD